MHTPQASPHWQLQLTFTVPSLRQAWPSQHQPWGAFTAVAVLLDTAQLSAPQHMQQLQALVPAGAAGTDPVQLLSAAAAGLLAAGETPEGTSQHSSSTCAAVSDPIHCSTTLYAALCNTLQQQQQAGQQFSRGASSVTTTAQPAALVLAATSSGQVWVYDPVAMLQDPQEFAGMPEPELQPGPLLKLLFDLQQRVVAVLPANLAAGTDALLLVGSLGRVVLVQQQQQQSTGLTAGQQLQLPFQVAAAAVVAAGGDSHASRQPQAGNAHLLLLLLSPSGLLYGASLHSVGAQPAAAAAGAGAQAGCATAAVTLGMLPLQPVQVQLPAAACRLWTVKQQPSSSNAVALNRTSASAVGCIHSSIVLQLTGSCQLLEVSVQDLQAAVAAAAGPSGSALLSTAVPGSSTPAAGAAAAAAVRQQLEQLLAALQTLATAQQMLEQAAVQQEAYLQGMQQDTKLLGLLQQQQQGRHSSGKQQQQQQRSLAAATDPANSQVQAALRCGIHLHGLWPVLGAASALDPSSNIHLALSVQLQQAIKAGSSSSAGFTGQLGPGWQLVVSFVPESADSSSVQTTVSINNDRGGGSSSSSGSAVGGGLQASLMLRLPARCAALQEGGWVVVYAVKHSPLSAHSLAGRTPPTNSSTSTAAAAAGCAWQGRQQQQQQQGQSSAQLRQGLPPVVTLLGYQYVGVMQLSAMAGANPGVQAAVKSAGTLCSQPPISSQAGSSTGSGAAPTYSCLLQLAAAAGASAGAGAPSDAAAGAHGGVKRARHGSTAAAAAAAGSAGQAPQQQAGSAGAQADRTTGSPAGALALQDWLDRALCLDPGPSEPPPPLVSSAHWNPFGGLPTVLSSSSSSRVSWRSRGGLQTEIGPAGLPPQVARQGQAVFVLGGGELGRASWGLSTAEQEVPSTQLLDAAAGGMQGSGAEGAGAPSLSVQLQAGRVPTLASMHRAVLLDLLHQLEEAGGSEFGGRVQSWRMVSSVPQLKLAAARLRQLHQQLLKLQDSAGEAQDLLARQANLDTVGQLAALLVGLEQVLCAGYGRFLLAVGDAVQVALCL